MTTVINLNVLNYYKLDTNRSAAANIHLNTRSSYLNKDYAALKERVVDVTDSFREVADEEIIQPEDSGFSNHLKQTLAGKTYDREGHTVQLFQAKGIYVDAFV